MKTNNHSSGIKSFLKNSAVLVFTDTIAKGFNFIALMLAANGLGAEQFGIFSSTFALVQICSFISEAGINRYLISIDVDKKDFIRKNVIPIILIRMFLWIVLVVIIMFVNIFVNFDIYLLLIWSVYFIINGILESWLTIFKMKKAFLQDAITKISGMVLLFAVILWLYLTRNQNISFWVVIFPITYLISMITGIISIIRLSGTPFLGNIFAESKRLLQTSFPYSLMTLSVAVYYSVDQVLLKTYGTNHIAGNYSAAYKLLIIILTIQNMASFVVIPELVKIVKKKILYRTAIKYFVLFQVLQIIGLLLVNTFANFFMNLIYSNDYDLVLIMFKYLSLNVIFVGLSIFSGLWILNITGFKKQLILGSILGAIVNFVLNLIFIPRLGYSGAIITTLVSEMIVGIYYTTQIKIHWEVLYIFTTFNVPFGILTILWVNGIIPIWLWAILSVFSLIIATILHRHRITYEK